jgi:RecB family endonuclease NucS
MKTFSYTRHDERAGRPNPTKLMIDGNLYHNLSTYRSTLGRYIRYRQEDATHPPEQQDVGEETQNERPIGLERDMQLALRSSIEQLETGLKIIDDDVERRVESGFIDITAQDRQGKVVVIELKTGVAGQRAVAQILSYMGDVVIEEDSPEIRGMLIAFDFDKKAIAAARMVPALELKKYRFSFQFEGV